MNWSLKNFCVRSVLFEFEQVIVAVLSHISYPILGLFLFVNNGDLSCIFALITGDNVEFNLRADHGLHELVRDWLLDSTAPVL